MELYSFDAPYIQRLQAGDPDTQRHFVSYFSELILIKLRARGLAHDVVDDVRQETFLRVFSSLRKGSLQQPDRLGPFVNSVCNNVLLEHFRSSHRAEPMAEDFDVADKKIDMNRALISEQSQRQVEAVLSQMKERDRRLLRAIFLEDQDKDQVCREYGVERTYLRVLLHRAKLQFRSLMTEPGGARG